MEANHHLRAAEMGLQKEGEIIHHHHHHHQGSHMPPSFGVMRSASQSFNDVSKEGSSDMGELDQAIFQFFEGQDRGAANQDQPQSSSGLRPPTLNIFPSQPMHVDPFPAPSKVNEGLAVSPSTSASKKSSEQAMDHLSMNDASSPLEHSKWERNRRGPASSPEHDGPKTRDPKTLRRLAQNREAARKSRLRRKAYVQQLETSRMRLTQLEQEIQKARAQGLYVGMPSLTGGDQTLSAPMASINSALFDVEYARWLEDHHQIVSDLRNAVADHLPENELHVLVDNCLSHYDQVTSLKGMIAKFDVFHLLSGTWRTPAERCFMWVGGFRPSELIKIIVREVEPLTEQQLMGICGLQQSTHEAEEALSEGLDSMYHSLSQAIVADSLAAPPNMNSYMSQMALAINNLSTLEAFIRQAENLRHQTLHQLRQILNVRQAARCLIAISEFFQRLRALSSLWLARPRQD